MSNETRQERLRKIKKQRTKRNVINLVIGGALFAGLVGTVSTIPAKAVEASGVVMEGAQSADAARVIADNVSIGGVDVSGMTGDEAEEAVSVKAAEAGDMAFTLVSGEKTVVARGSDLGVTWSNTSVIEDALMVGRAGDLLGRYKNKKDLEENGKSYSLKYTIDPARTENFLRANEAALTQKPVNAGLEKTADGFNITGGTPGVSLNIDGSVEAVRNFVTGIWQGGDAEITMAVTETPPAGTREELEKVKDVLGSFHTDFGSSSAARATNIRVATEFINGTVVYPGEEFSVYDTIGPTDETNGYELAGAYENGQTVQAYGGGVCQVSSTLYNAVLFAELEVVKRSPHSMTVSYVEPSRDAAIAGDYKNFIFRNNTEAPIYIEGYTSNMQLFFNIFGQETRDPNRTISFESVTLSDVPQPTTCIPTGDPIGHVVTISGGHAGKNCELYKIVKVNGEETERIKINSSSYRSTERTVHIGTGTDNPEAAAAMGAAFATGSYDAIMAVVNQYKGVPAPAPAPEVPVEMPVEVPVG